MTSLAMFSLCGMMLFGIGFFGVIACRHLVRKLIAVNLMSAGVFLLLIAMAKRTPGGGPDPVPHAMVLTGIVVAISATALALALIRRFYDETGRVELPPLREDGEVKGDG